MLSSRSIHNPTNTNYSHLTTFVATNTKKIECSHQSLQVCTWSDPGLLFRHLSYYILITPGSFLFLTHAKLIAASEPLYLLSPPPLHLHMASFCSSFWLHLTCFHFGRLPCLRVSQALLSLYYITPFNFLHSIHSLKLTCSFTYSFLVGKLHGKKIFSSGVMST